MTRFSTIASGPHYASSVEFYWKGDNARFGTFIYRRVNPQIDGAVTSVFASFDPLGTVSARPHH